MTRGAAHVLLLRLRVTAEKWSAPPPSHSGPVVDVAPVLDGDDLDD